MTTPAPGSVKSIISCEPNRISSCYCVRDPAREGVETEGDIWYSPAYEPIKPIKTVRAKDYGDEGETNKGNLLVKESIRPTPISRHQVVDDRGDKLLHIADNSVVGNAKDGSFFVFIDRDDKLTFVHS